MRGQPPRARPPASPAAQAPAGHAHQRDVAGPARPHTRAHSTWTADPDCPPRGRAAGGGRAPDLRRPSQRHEAPPEGLPPAIPTARNAGPQKHTLWGRCWVQTPTTPVSGRHGQRGLAARSVRWVAGRGKAPDTRHPSERLEFTNPGTTSRHPCGARPPASIARQKDSAGPARPHTRPQSTWAADPNCLPWGLPWGERLA